MIGNKSSEMRMMRPFRIVRVHPYIMVQAEGLHRRIVFSGASLNGSRGMASVTVPEAMSKIILAAEAIRQLPDSLLAQVVELKRKNVDCDFYAHDRSGIPIGEARILCFGLSANFQKVLETIFEPKAAPELMRSFSTLLNEIENNRHIRSFEDRIFTGYRSDYSTGNTPSAETEVVEALPRYVSMNDLSSYLAAKKTEVMGKVVKIFNRMSLDFIMAVMREAGCPIIFTFEMTER